MSTVGTSTLAIAVEFDLDRRDLVIEVLPENVIRFVFPRIDPDRVIATAVAPMLAEALDARLEDVRVESRESELPHTVATHMSSGNVHAMWEPARALAAAARMRLVSAAARQFGVPADQIVTRETRAFSPDGRSSTFGELSSTAALIGAPDPLASSCAGAGLPAWAPMLTLCPTP